MLGQLRRLRRHLLLQLHRQLFYRLLWWLRKGMHLLWVELHQQLLLCVFRWMFRLHGVRLDLWQRMLLRLHGGLRRKLQRQLWIDLHRLQWWLRLNL